MPTQKPILRVRQLFQEASELPEEQWVSFLQSAEQDPAIRERVLGLLRRLGSVEGAFVGRASEVRTDREPEQIGPYRILRRIGEGGMGVVYLAEQDQPVVRSVALKRIRPGMDSEAVLRRFERERQALASMDHPNIAKVYDAGVDEDGRPYVAMEYIAGSSVSDWCDRNELSTEDRIALFTDVCRGVQHAHQRGVLHRDLKPSNVIVAEVDGKPETQHSGQHRGGRAPRERPPTPPCPTRSGGAFAGRPRLDRLAGTRRQPRATLPVPDGVRR